MILWCGLFFLLSELGLPGPGQPSLPGADKLLLDFSWAIRVRLLHLLLSLVELMLLALTEMEAQPVVVAGVVRSDLRSNLVKVMRIDLYGDLLALVVLEYKKRHKCCPR